MNTLKINHPKFCKFLLIDGLKLKSEIFLCCVEGVPYHHGNRERPHPSRNRSDDGCLLGYIVKVNISQQLGFTISCLDTSDPCKLLHDETQNSLNFVSYCQIYLSL